MAKELKPGERVTVNGEVRISSKSETYKHGLKKINPGDIGEVVGPADGRALTVKFNGIETVVSKLRLTRPAELSVQTGKPAPAKTAKGKTAGIRPVEQPHQQATARTTGSSAQGFEDGGLQLLNAVANKLLRGGTRVEQDGVVELSLKDLPAEVREHLQALIDAKLAFNPKDLVKK